MLALLRASVVTLLLAATLTTSPAVEKTCTLPVIGAVCAPATVVLDGKLLQQNKLGVQLGDRTLRASLGALLTQANKALTAGPWSVMDKDRIPPSGDKHDYLSLAPYWWATTAPTEANPWGCPYVQKDGVRNPLVDSISDHAERGTAFSAIYQLSLAWYYTGKAAYAQRAALDLRTWFVSPATRMNPNMNFAQGIPCKVDGRGIGIIEFSYAFTQVLDAMAILDLGAPGWSAQDHSGMNGWSTEFLNWLRTNKNGTDEAAATNNHGSFYDMMVAALALSTGQKALAASVVQAAKAKRIDVQIKADGYQPLESTRTRSWHYFTFNLVALTRLAQIGQHVGVDLWHYRSPTGGSILGAVDYLIPGATQGQSVWPYPEMDFRQYAAVDVLHAAALNGDKAARSALVHTPTEPGGDLFPIRPAAEQLDDISTPTP